MKLNFAKLNPTQNMTIIVNDPVPRSLHCAVAGKLMDYGSVGAEQVGFREPASLPGARVRLQMMGGEFCGNASMSMAALLAYEDGLADGDTAVIPLEVSGAEGIMNCRIQRKGNAYEGTVAMPRPSAVLMCKDGEAEVLFDGIIHRIVPEGNLTDAEAEAFAAEQCKKRGADAYGVLLVNADCTAFRPLVYVAETGSAVWERGCGSGSAAIGAYMAAVRGEDVSIELSQPGGSIRVEAAWTGGTVTSLQITGTVKIAAMGTAWIDD